MKHPSSSLVASFFRLLIRETPLLFSKVCVALFVCLAIPDIASAQIQNSEFDSLVGWYPAGNIDVSISNDSYQSGNACLVKNRTLHWMGITQSLVGDLEPGKDYHVTSYIKLVGSTDKAVQIQVKHTDDRGTRFYKIGEILANDTEWTLLEAGFNFQSNGTTTELEFIFNAPSTVPGEFEFDYLVDSVKIVENNWQAAADARIDQFRKRDAELTIVNQNGRTALGLEVDVQQVNHHFGFGSTLNHDVKYNPIYRDFFKRNFKRATIEYFSQWKATEKVRGVEDYVGADFSVDFANANGIKIKGHALAYPLRPFLPDWLLLLPAAEVQAELEERLTNVATRYDGRLTGWDVSNEMLEEDWVAETLGESYRAWMFQRARELSPDAILSTNEYGMENSVWKTKRYRKLVEDLVAAGADVGEIGLQSHFFDGYVSPKGIEIAIDELAGLGIDFYFTEFDYVNSDPVARAQGLENFYRYAFSRPEANGITMWGFWAGAHWRGPDAALVDLDWTVNAAGQKYFELIDEWTTSLSEDSGSGEAIEFRGFHGDYLITTLDPEKSVTNYHLVTLPEGEGAFSQELRVNSLNGSLNIYGTDGDDLFQYDLQQPDRFLLNGEVVLIDPPVEEFRINFVGGGGDDRLKIESRPTNQHFIFSGQRLTVVGDQAIGFDEIEAVEGIARTLGSTATMLDTVAYNSFVSLFEESWMTTPDTEIRAKNFRFVFARSSQGGNDSAWIFGSPNLADRFYSDSEVMSIRTGARNRRAIGFDQTVVYSSGGNDVATIDLTAAPNSLAVAPTDIFHQTDVGSLNLLDFTRVTVNGAENNSDSVSISGNDSNETLRIYEDLVTLDGAGFRVILNDINHSTYSSPSGGSDRVVLYDTPGNDILSVTDTVATYSNSGASHTLTGLDSIRANSTSGGTDTATISGSSPATILVGDWN